MTAQCHAAPEAPECKRRSPVRLGDEESSPGTLGVCPGHPARRGDEPRRQHLPEKFLVASMVVRMAPWKTQKAEGKGMLGPGPPHSHRSPSPQGGKPCSSPVPWPPRWKETGPRADILLLPSKAAIGTQPCIPSTRALGCILRNCLPSKMKGILNIPRVHFGVVLPRPRCSTTPLTGAGSWQRGEPPGAEPDLMAIKAMPAKSSRAGIFHESHAKITTAKLHS